MADNPFLTLGKLRRAGRAAVLATIVRGKGPTYRRPGATMVIPADGPPVGAISGGCIQSDLLEAATAVLDDARPRLLEYDTSSPDDLLFGTASGCGGLMAVLVAPVPDDILAEMVAQLNQGCPVVLKTDMVTGRRVLGGSTDLGLHWYEDEGQTFCQTIEPPPRLIVCGAGDDAVPVVGLAAVAGFLVTVVDHRPLWATPERFPEADRVVVCEAGGLEQVGGDYAVLVTHHYEHDLTHLRVLLQRPMAYVGLLGSRERARLLAGDLLAERPDLAPAARSVLRAPVGLDIGADGPQEIAIAIVAELIAERARRPGTPLSLRGGVLPDREVLEP